VAWGVGQLVLALVTAVGIAALLGQLWPIEWRGAVATIMTTWDTYVRPAVAGVLHGVVTAPLARFGVEVDVPLWVRDYLVVGIAATLSLVGDRRVRGETAIGSAFVRRWYRAVWTVGVWPAAMVAILFYLPVRRMNRSLLESGVDLRLTFRIAVPLVSFTGLMLFVPFTVRALMAAPDILPGTTVYLVLFFGYAWVGLLFLSIGYRQSRDADLKQAAMSLGLALVPLLGLATLLALNAWVMPAISPVELR
jgi:hypothetical protein